MGGFFWNIRGFNKSTKHGVVRSWVRNNNFQFGCLIETRVKEKKAKEIVSSVFQGWDFMANYEHNHLGRLWVVWEQSVRMTPVYKSDQLITVSVLLPGESEEFFCSFVYALNTVEERRILWEDIKNHYEAPMFRSKRWMIMGDYNEILEGNEHSGFENLSRNPVGMREFQEVANFCRLTDMGFQGPLLTWCNKREEGLICKKLDRVLVNEVWLNKLDAYCVFEAGGCSDHLRCRIQLEKEEERRRKPFKFTNALAKFPEFLPLIEDHWRNHEPLFNSTSAMFLLTKRLKTLKQPLRELSKLKLGDLSRRTKEAYNFLYLEEDYLKQKSKLHWLDVGDGNNRVFHNAAKIREVRNTIHEIQCSDGRIAKNKEEIKVEAIKSPGPDGYTSEFFKESWAVIGDDITVAVQSFFDKGFLPKGINSTILALVPKKSEAKVMRDYRPISCCNVLYKLISKILAKRLKGILPKCITWNQSAFIKERLLMENVLLATELVKDYHKETISPRCAMKIDISKAFDSVQWTFLINTLKALGLPERFIHWISLCITTASFSVQVNGELAGYFQSKRGLRQGCSLSPYLFVICMNVLSRMIDEAAKKGKIGFHPKCKNIDLTHLCFADDLMIFADGTKRSVEEILRVFDAFDKMSGLRISLEKSTLFLAGVSAQKQDEILSHFPFESGSLPVRYLGLPLLTKNMTVLDYMPLIEKIRKRISSWTGRFLSYAGRLQLIKSVITSLANFWMAAFRLPSGCIKEIERLCSAFLWSGTELNNRKAKVSWADICSTKQEGGLGLRRLKEVNTVSCLKLIWRILSSNSMWVNWVKIYLIRKSSIWMVKENTQSGSWMWKKILKCRDLAKRMYKVEVKNGKKTSFWFENWSSMGCLKDILSDGSRIDLGILSTATVEESWSHRRRSHRVLILNKVEDEIVRSRRSRVNEEDVSLWMNGKSQSKKIFSSKETWEYIRVKHQLCNWHHAVWFKYSTPKYSFILWTAMKGRLATGERMRSWSGNTNVACVLCSEPLETLEHLFFECDYSSLIWEALMKGILKDQFTVKWGELIRMMRDLTRGRLHLFILKYMFQASVYMLWRERNRRRHGEVGVPAALLVKLLDKNMRNKFTLIQRKGDSEIGRGMQYWFQNR
ncbi:uncharacterized protein LOC130495492 [Raphanus sativus]|uniref:Uncharacterized protein LOC130495492 n=1 Tax=Raphanus sativus TaxID=3726 RepID=A0A9W3BUG2_RAPSA|nr:uncharacterized protein LOC130495492 [Raphanus sativus]